MRGLNGGSDFWRQYRSLVLLLGFAGSLMACGGGGGGGGPTVTQSDVSFTNPNLSQPIDDVTGDSGSGGSSVTIGQGGANGQNTEAEWQAFLGTATPSYVDDPLYYQTPEYYYGRPYGSSSAPLAAVNFADAYARGWTGHGSLVTVADTGIDMNHPDFAGQIAHYQDFTGTGLADNDGHGSHVAGIVAAGRDGFGNHGAAFDARLAVAKVADGSSYSFDMAREAAAWGRDLGSVSVNVSAAYLRDYALEQNMIKLAEGEYYLDHPTYGVHGVYGSRGAALAWRGALGDQQVLVKAAGNNNTAYSGAMNQMATASYDDGTLILDGQMLVVGNWDPDFATLNGNRAGNVCVTWRDGACIDGAKIKDFYIMAPGTRVVSTWNDGGYATLSGSSMAAPMVAGAIAVLHQMWPHMAGRDLVSLILQTADKSVSGYAEHIHGQGLLDMEQATLPLGAVGLPVDGRTSGVTVAPAGGMTLAAVPAGLRDALSAVMALDTLERDFRIDLGAQVISVDTRRGSHAEAAGRFDAYAAYLPPHQRVRYDLTLGEDTGVILGGGREEAGFLGNQMSGSFGAVRASHTAYALVRYFGQPVAHSLARSLDRSLASNGGWIWRPEIQIGGGVTLLDLDTAPSLLQTAGPVLSTSWMLGLAAYGDDARRLQFSLSQPVHIESAPVTYRVPMARTVAGEVRHTRYDGNLRGASREIDLGVSYRHGGANDAVEFVAFAEARTGVEAFSGDVERRVGMRLAVRL